MLFFFFNDTATTEIYTLSLHDALPISSSEILSASSRRLSGGFATQLRLMRRRDDCSKGRRKLLTPCSQRGPRSEEHTSELQSLAYLVCRLLLEKKKEKKH